MEGRACSTSCSSAWAHKTWQAAAVQGRPPACRLRRAACAREGPRRPLRRPSRATAGIDATPQSDHLPEREADAIPPEDSDVGAAVDDFDEFDDFDESMPIDVATEEDILAFCRDMARIADDMKAEDVVLMDVQGSVSWTSYFLVMTVFSRPQLSAVLGRMRKEAGEVWGRTPGGSLPGRAEWEVLDFQNVVVHALSPRQREKYDLESLYEDAGRIDLRLGERTEGQWDAVV
eukprot:evm.model.scf_194.4 EVM.evm.TU.scf_194.4   scf_194:26357-27052(+)